MKKVLVLGAGIYQVPLIKKAKEMGLYTIVASIKGNYPGFEFADKVIYENTVDLDAILKVAKEEQIDGAVVCGTDVCVPTLGFLCDRLGIKGPSYEAAIIAQDKAKMKAAFDENGVRTAKSYRVSIENTNPVEICEEIGYPVIFKSVDSSGSRGITRVNNESEIEYAYTGVKNNTKSPYYIIEKFLIGEEFGAQAFVQDGAIEFILPHGDYVFHGDTGVPIGHFAPYDIPEEVVEDAKIQLTKAIKAMKIDNCAINADFILCDGKTYVLEIGARAGATCLVEMTEIFYGFDYYKKIIQVAMGEKTDFLPVLKEPQPNAEMLFMSDKTGTINSITVENGIDERVVNLSFDYGVGDEVRKFAKGPDRIGQIIVKADSVAIAKSVIDETMKKVHIDVI